MQYCGGLQYREGYHDARGGYFEYCGDAQYRGGYHDKCGDILSTAAVFSTLGDIMNTVWGYLEYHGGYSVLWEILSKVGDITMHVGDIMSTVGKRSFVI